MVCKSEPNFDPLDLEILERAFDGAWATFKEDRFASDEELEALLQLELTEIAAFNGANDVQRLRDLILLAAKMHLKE
jgi:hypothetical protein